MSVLTLGIHISGFSNSVSDDLSRNTGGPFLDEAAQAGLTLCRLLPARECRSTAFDMLLLRPTGSQFDLIRQLTPAPCGGTM